MNKKPTYIDLFAGCGGLSLGLYNAGWKGLFAIEKSPFAFATLEHNLIKELKHFKWPAWLEKKNHDINEVLRTNANELKSLRDKVDLIVGGPPCQGFSTAGKRNEADQRNTLINSYIKFIRFVQPKLIFFENVRGFTHRFEQNKSKGKVYSDYVEGCLKRSTQNYQGYNVYGELVDFSEFGVPQKRTRFILVGVRKDLCQDESLPLDFFKLIKANRGTFLADKGITTTVSIKDAISDLLAGNGTVNCPDSNGFQSGLYAKPKSNYQKFLRKKLLPGVKIPDSHRLSNHNDGTIKLFEKLINGSTKGKRITEEERAKFKVKKRSIIVLDQNSPSPTLTSHPDDYVHYSEARILTVREYARIQTFPDWYHFKKKYTTGGQDRKVEVPRYTQLGNAIPPLFGEQAGNALISLI